MPANISYSMGRYNAMYVGYPAWHNLGTVVAEAKAPEEAQKIAGTDYLVAKARIAAEINGEWVPMPDHAATYRTDTGAIFGPVAVDYPIIQNITPMQMLMEIVGTGEAGIVAHAALGKGERLFAVLDLRLLKDMKVPWDPSTHDAFLVAQWWHNAQGAFTVGEALVRTDCQNMANAQLAYAEQKGRLVRIVHRGDITDTVQEARRILGYAERDITAFMNLLAKISEPVIRKPKTWIDGFTERLIPIPEKMERPGTRIEAREAIKHLFLESKTMVGVPTSPYRAFQAVTEYADHYRPLRVADEVLVPARRFTTAVDGPAADLKQTAMRLLKEEFEIR